LVEHALDLRLLAHIGLDHDGSTATRLDLQFGALRTGSILELVDDDIGAFLGEFDGRSLADPRVRTGDQRDLPF
jgi:hypothetical protein